MTDRRPHGRTPQMSAALRRAFADLKANTDEAVGQRLVDVGIEPRDAEALVNAMHDYFHEDSRVFEMAWRTLYDAGQDGADPDALPLIDALREFPEGQRQSLKAVLGVALRARGRGRRSARRALRRERAPRPLHPRQGTAAPLSTCGVWPSDDGPCGQPGAEVLVFCNPRCAGGPLVVCREHLAEYLEDQVLGQPKEGAA